jgi:hypothetical protein
MYLVRRLVNLADAIPRLYGTRGDLGVSEDTEVEIYVDEEGDPITFGSWKSVKRFLREEMEFWSWLEPRTDADQFGVASHVQSELRTAFNEAESAAEDEDDISEAYGVLTRFEPEGALLSRQSPAGIIVADIREALGPSAGAYAYGLIKERYNISNSNSIDHLRAAMLTAFPNMIDPVKLAKRLASERANFREAARQLHQRMESERAAQALEAKELLQRASRVAVRAIRNRGRYWQNQRDDWQDRADAAVASIGATESAYKEAMKLQASVEYWRDKAKQHAAQERSALNQLQRFFPISLVVLCMLFGVSGWWVISHANDHGGSVPTALYVVLSGGLAVISTIIFWVGRLLTKLYLSEHHLRNDAEERAVMTTTYLALTKEHAAEEADRQIVLSALFRTTPDGIVKDDGPGDASLQAFASRLLAR